MSNIIIDTSKPKAGIVGVQFMDKIPSDIRLKVYTNKVGTPEYHYNIQRNDMVYYPLQYGNGDYTVSIFQEVQPNLGKYKKIESTVATVKAIDPLAAFLQSNVNMEWHKNMKSIKFAASLVQGVNQPIDKIATIWKHMVNEYKYDNDLASNVKYNYIPDIERVFVEKKGICFSLTAVFNSMLRSMGIKAKMVHGTAPTGIYHAWSEIFLGGKWHHTDITFDIATYKNKNASFLLGDRDSSKYTTKFIY